VAGLNIVGMLEEVLYDPDRTQDCGPFHLNASKNPRQMESADEMLDAMMERVEFYTRISTVSWNVAHQTLMDHKADPCTSFLTDDCLYSGIDMQTVNKEGDDFPNVLPFGAMNASDSLAAIQKLIFDEKKYTVDQLVQALQANWDGHESMRLDFVNAPKYGNDDDYADEWALKIRLRLAETIARVKDAWGRPITMDGSVATGYAMYGMASGATPDGRFAGTPLADGTSSPVAGMDRNGPTSVLNSVSKIPWLHPDLFNQRMMPQFLEGDNRKLFADYLRVWYQNGTNWHIQFNVVSTEDLLDAKKHPEKHTGLVVRVAGYSAHFIDLPEPLQDSIIARNEQNFARSCCR
jgi:pyruvate-formate lyase